MVAGNTVSSRADWPLLIDYLAGKGVFKISPARIGKIAVWSCRFWAAYVVLCVSVSPPQTQSIAH